MMLYDAFDVIMRDFVVFINHNCIIFRNFARFLEFQNPLGRQLLENVLYFYILLI